MAYKDLRDFINRLEREGELNRIDAKVDVDLEITEITDRVSKAGGPALLFQNPRSAKDGVAYPMPVLINTLGSRKRIEMALEVVMEERCNECDEGIEREDDKTSPGPASRRTHGHGRSIDTSLGSGLPSLAQ